MRGGRSMFDIIACLDSRLNSNVSSIKEILYEFTCTYSIAISNLPSKDILMGLLEDIPDQDKMVITFAADEDTVYVAEGEATWIEEYEQFCKSIYCDNILVSVEIKKNVTNGSLNVYNLQKFQEFLASCSIESHLINFSKLFINCGEHIAFRLLNTNGSLWTQSISFSDNEIQWGTTERSRSELIRNCDDASVFLERTNIQLIPQDFTIQGPLEGSDFITIVRLFNDLRNILSYIYISNTSSIHKDKAILHFDPTSVGYEYTLQSLSQNSIVALIYDWVFKDDGCVDKASIARKIINVYCRTEDELLEIDQRVFNSIKSDFQIYQKNHVEQYIDMKNRISDHIVESAKQIQELTHELSEAIRNNFVAIIVFIMTVLLTESIDISKLLEKNISPRITAVCAVFTLASLLYLIVTIITSNQKWKWLDQSYKDLKENYKKTLDDADIEEAFNNDAPFKHAKNQYNTFKKKVMGLWIAAIVVMGVFTGVLFYNGSNNDELKITGQIQGTTIDSLLQEESTQDTDAKDENNGTDLSIGE